MKKHPTLLALVLFMEAWTLLATARLMVLLIPFRFIAPLLGKNVPAGEYPVQLPGDNKLQQQLSLAISRAVYRSPWRTKCLEQAIAAKIMLKYRRISSTVFFGINKPDQHTLINAHTWLVSGGLIVTGGRHIDSYNVIACFKS